MENLRKLEENEELQQDRQRLNNNKSNTTKEIDNIYETSFNKFLVDFICQNNLEENYDTSYWLRKYNGFIKNKVKEILN